MLLEVKNIQGCKEAKINLPPGQVVMLSGPNESGKSSVLLALRALLSLDPDPAAKGKTKQKGYVNFNAQVAADSYARLSIGKSTYTWKPGEGIDEKGDTLSSPLPVAVPVLNPAALNLPSLTDRQKAWTDTLGLGFSREEVQEALESCTDVLPNGQKVLETLLDMLFNEAVDSGTAWKQAETYARDHKLAASRDWVKIVAEAAGEKKTWTKKQGASWRPPNFPIEAEGKTLKAAMDEEQQASERYTCAEREHLRTYLTPREMEMKRAELSQSEQDQRSAKDELTELEAQHEHSSKATYAKWEADRSLIGDHEKADLMISQLVEAIKRGREFEASGRHKSEDTEKAGFHRCPHCHKWLKIEVAKGTPPSTSIVATQGPLTAETNEDFEKLQEHEALLAQWNTYKQGLRPKPTTKPPEPGTLVRLPQEIVSKRGHHAQLVRRTKEITDVLDKAYVAEDSTAPQQLGELADDLEAKRRIVACIKAQQDAETAHTRASLWEQIWHQLKPSGLRYELIEAALEDVNETLHDFTGEAKWPDGRLEVDLKQLKVFCGAVPFEDFSTSQKLRVSAALAVILAYQVESPVAVIDNLDWLVGINEPLDTASGLFDALSNIAEATEIAVLGAVASFDQIGDYHGIAGVFEPVTDGSLS